MKSFLSRGVLLLLLIVAGLSVSDVARSASSYNKTVRIIAGKADTVELNSPVADVLVANPAVADVGTLRANRLYIVGKSVGDTNVLAYDDRGNQLANITIQVRADDKNLQDTLREFFPNEKVIAHTVKNNIVLSGTVSSPAVANQVRDLTTHFLTDKTQLVDLMKIQAEQQVMLKVRVMEANRTALRELGVTSFIGNPNVNSALNNSTRFALSRGDAPPSLPVTLGGLISGQQAFGTGELAIGSNARALVMSLEGLEQQGLVNTLAEPNLTAINGETAGFLAGGEFPIPSSKDAQGNVVVTLTPFGVSLNFTPTVMDKDRIALHLSTEVSNRDTSDSVTLNGLQIPGLSVRRAETTVELGSGSTLMIAGLLQSNVLHTVEGMPGVQDLPIIGELFKSKSFQRGESELLIMVTPYLVNPYSEPEAVAEKSPPASISPASPPIKDEKPVSPPVKSGSADHVPAPAAQPVRAAQLKPQPQLERVDGSPSAINQSLLDNLGKTYGVSAMDKVGTGGRFGYIVE